jgi:hypothetical protein
MRIAGQHQKPAVFPVAIKGGLMLTLQDASSCWGVQNMMCVRSAALENSCLPARSKEFLATVGFPKTAEPWANFDAPRSSLLTLSDYIEQYNKEQRSTSTRPDLDLPPPDANLLYRVGSFGYKLHICIEQPTGRVYQLCTSSVSKMFVNSSIEQLVECLFIFQSRFQQRYEEYFFPMDGSVVPEGIPAFAPEFQRCIDQIDSLALACPHNKWSGIVKLIGVGGL